MKYPELQPGEWVRPRMSGWFMACCDCQLVHRVRFRVRRGRVCLTADRDYRKTAALRRETRKRKG